MKRLIVAAAAVFVLTAATTSTIRPIAAPVVVKPDVPDGICQWCWWCLECWIVPATPSIEYQMQQTFNPF